MVLDFRECRWEGCEETPESIHSHFCSEHRLKSHLLLRIRHSERCKLLDKELRGMKKEKYVELYNELQEKVLKELEEEEKEK